MVGSVVIKNNCKTYSKYINLAQYKCYEPIIPNINLKYNGTNIKYDSKNKLLKQKEMISLAIIDEFYNLTRNCCNTNSGSSNFFLKVIKSENISLKENMASK